MPPAPRRLLVLLAAGALLLGAASASPAAPLPARTEAALVDSPSSLQLVQERVVSPRVRDYTFTTPALDAPTSVRVLLPTSYQPGSTRRYPVLYLLHGGAGQYTDWTTAGSAEQLTEGLDLIVVMPDAGRSAWYTDWYRAGLGGQPRWESYHVGQLVPWVDAHLPTRGTRSGRAVVGLSSGGFGALSYASRHQDLFVAAAGFSGALDTNAPPVVSGLVVGTLAVQDRGDQSSFWGLRATDEVRWRGHNPWDLAENLRQTALTVRAGNGEAGGEFGGGGPADPGGYFLEYATHTQTVSFHERLGTLGIDHVYEDYGPGTHSYAYWDRDLRKTLPTLMDVFAEDRDDPTAFRTTAVEPSFGSYGWTVDVTRPALEFATLDVRGPGSFSVSGSGTAAVTTGARLPRRRPAAGRRRRRRGQPDAGAARRRRGAPLPARRPRPRQPAPAALRRDGAVTGHGRPDRAGDRGAARPLSRPRVGAVETARALADAVRRGQADPVDLVEQALAPAGRRPAGGLRERRRRGRPRSRPGGRGAAAGPCRASPSRSRTCTTSPGRPPAPAATCPPGPPAAADSPAVARLRAAGAVVLGRTRTHEWAWGITTQHPRRGGTRNPVDPTRVPGGSSGGSAAAVASGVVPLALGTDTGASIRLPAAWCGLVGFKPTHGSVPLDGVVPLGPSLDTGGALVRDVADARLAHEVLSGARPAGAAAGAGPAARRRAGRPPLPRARAPDGSGRAGRAAAVGAGLAAGRPAGAASTPPCRGPRRSPGTAPPAAGRSTRTPTARTCGRCSSAPRADSRAGPGGRPGRAGGAAPPGGAAVRRGRRRAGAGRALRAVRGRRAGPRAGRRRAAAGRRAAVDRPGQPGRPAGVHVPAGVDEDGLPVGVQVVGPPGADALVLDVAAALARR